MRKILVTTDSSPVSNHAVLHAQALAKALGAELRVLAVEPDPISLAVGQFGYLPPITDQAIQEENQDFRASLKSAFPDLTVRVEQASGRPTHQIILDTARDEHADLIVMSTHGRSGLGRVLLGSVAEGVVHQASVPVMLIKGDQTVVNWQG